MSNSKTRGVALITGASSGIGRELARIHAQQGGDLVIVARREEELNELKRELESKHGVSVRCHAMDLAEPSAGKYLYDRICSEQIDVQYLMNNAGFGGHGLFHQRDWEKDRSMIQLNVLALTEITRFFLPDLIARRDAKILNTASTAGFIPGPLQAVYYATKAYVLSFSQAIDEELRSIDANVSVTALCPGPVETEFASTGDLEDVDAFKNAASPKSVAQIGYDAMMRGRLVAINDWKFSLLLNWIVPFLPRRTVLKLSRKSMEKSH